jgi:hypothetical protein
VSIFLQTFRLSEQQELRKPNLIDLARQFLARTRQSRGNASNQLGRPFEVISVVMSGLQRAEQRIVFEPMPMRVAELPVSRLQLSRRPGAEVAPSRFENPALERDDGAVIDCRCRKRLGFAVGSPQQSVLDQAIRADQQLIARKGGQGLVGRVAIPCWAKRQRLPPALPGLAEAVHPRLRSRPQIANAVGRRQRCDMQQDP